MTALPASLLRAPLEISRVHLSASTERRGSSFLCDVPHPPVSSLPSREYRSRFTNEETVSFCLRVMVGVIILYDHVHPVGAFAKTSKIDVSCIIVHNP